MTRYVDRDAVKRAIQEYCFSPKEITPDGIAKVVMSVPTVDAVEVRHGEWTMVEEEAFWIQNMKESLETGKPTIEKIPVCSICKTKFGTLALDYNYCPNCGAKMDGERSTKNAT